VLSDEDRQSIDAIMQQFFCRIQTEGNAMH
jgi:hypothetical protein